MKYLRTCKKSLIMKYPHIIAKVAPCIYFKLNNIWGWEPRPVKCNDGSGTGWDDDEDGPLDDCPDSLREHLGSQAAKAAGPDNIWIDCNGRFLLFLWSTPTTSGQECRWPGGSSGQNHLLSGVQGASPKLLPLFGATLIFFCNLRSTKRLIRVTGTKGNQRKSTKNSN